MQCFELETVPVSHYIEQLPWWKYYWDSSSTNSNLFSDKSLQYSLKPRTKNKQYSKTIAVIEIFREKKIPDFRTFINKDTIHFFMWSKNKQQLTLQSNCCGFNVIDKYYTITLKSHFDKRTNKSHCKHRNCWGWMLWRKRLQNPEFPQSFFLPNFLWGNNKQKPVTA